MYGMQREGRPRDDGSDLENQSTAGRVATAGRGKRKAGASPKNLSKKEASQEKASREEIDELKEKFDDLIFWQQVAIYIASGRRLEFDVFISTLEETYRGHHG